MKKQKVKRKASKPKYLPEGRLLSELVFWNFTQDEDVIRHIAGEVARAIQLSYSLENFGPESFGISDEEEGDG
jgi:hypothetical protein